MNTPTQSNNNTRSKKLEVFSEERDLQKFLEVNFTESLRQMIKVTVKSLVKSEMEAFRKEFSERLQFNGCYDRNLLSSFGKVEGIPIPRFRQPVEGGLPLKSLSLFEEEQNKFMKLVEQMHLLGISQRKIRHLVKGCFGITLSANRVGAIYSDLVEKEEININQKALDDNFEYLLLDGIWEKTKGYWLGGKQISPALCFGSKSQWGEKSHWLFPGQRRRYRELEKTSRQS